MQVPCGWCGTLVKRKPSELRDTKTKPACSKDCEREIKRKYLYPDTLINKFVKRSWTNINLRAGKYRKHQTVPKSRTYKNINVVFSREEFKSWCLNQKSYILSLHRPSIDRLDNAKDYSLDNIQVIELRDNIGKEKRNKGIYEGIRQDIRDGCWEAQITILGKRYYLGRSKDPEDAHQLYVDARKEWYGK